MKTDPHIEKLDGRYASFKRLVMALLALGTVINSAQGDIVGFLNAVADTTLQEALPNNNYGGGTTIAAGVDPQDGRTRALLKFDFTRLAGGTVKEVSLRLSVVDDPAGGLDSDFELHRLLASWGEGNGNDRDGSPARANEATWNNRFGSSGSPWMTAGGDFSPTASASQFIAGTGAYSFPSTAALVADVQYWVDNPSQNFGWLLKSQAEDISNTIRRFGSRNHPDSGTTVFLTFRAELQSPTITSQPQNQSVILGSNAHFNVIARYGGAYQWRKHSGDIIYTLEDGARVSGATTANLSIANVNASDVGVYSVVVTNILGSVTSAYATLSLSLISPNLAINWFTIDGGGGSSANSTLAIKGTIGQPEAGKLSGNNLAIEGGFWGAIAVVQIPGAPLLTITRTPTNTVVVSWPSPSTGFGLQQNIDLNTANWGTAPEDVKASEDGTTKFIVVNPPVGNRFYRLFKP